MDLKQAVEDILFSGEDYFLITRGINSFYDHLSNATQIFAGDLTNEHMKETKNGKVVTPVHAAHCVKDLMRTTQFLRGIHKAIEHYLNKHESIRILYAGCGPYATLLTPFTALYSPEQLRFTFLEIEEVSFNAVKKLYDDWELKVYLDEVRLTDAVLPDITFPEPFHIIISETMQVGLKNECQVPITRNLVRFLTDNGTFIPEKVSLEVYLTGSIDSLKPNNVQKEFLGTAYDLDFRNVPGSENSSIVSMKASELNYLQLFTEIHLFGGVKLTARQSGLTIPLTLDRLSENRPEEIHFKYLEGKAPGLTFEYSFE